MPINNPRTKVLFLPVIRGNYPAALTRTVKAAARQEAGAMAIDAIFPDDGLYTEGVIRTDDDIHAYAQVWSRDLAHIKALVVISGDFMRERVVQDTVRQLPADVPVFLVVNNDDPNAMSGPTVGDSLCGTLSVHHNVRMLARRVVRSARINMHDPAVLREHLAGCLRVADGIEALRNLRIAMVGINPTEFVTTFTNQLKLFELGFSLHTYELCSMWADTALAALADDAAGGYRGPFGEVKFWRPVRKSDPRVAEARARLAELVPHLPADPARTELIARCFVWIRDTFEQDRIDTGAIHCWSEFGRFFGMAPCAFAMLANMVLRKPLVCEVDVCHAIMARLAWALTGEAGVILDVNNNGWDPRVFNVFHCSQTPTNWIRGGARVSDFGTIEGALSAVPFTGIAAGTSSDAFHATVFQGHLLNRVPALRGTSGWAFVPNFPDVLATIEQSGIHHFVALKGHLGADAAEVLRFRGLHVEDRSAPMADLAQIEAGLPHLGDATLPRCPAFG